jgi:hypothetical protein
MSVFAYVSIPWMRNLVKAMVVCRLTQRMQRTAQSVTRFAFASRPPLFSAADARR